MTQLYTQQSKINNFVVKKNSKAAFACEDHSISLFDL
jgi:hypothetical protein